MNDERKAELAKTQQQFTETVERWADDMNMLKAELAKAREALADVCNPLGKMRRDAEAQGAVLSGMAYQVANSLAYVQDIARAALPATPEPQPVEEMPCASD